MTRDAFERAKELDYDIVAVEKLRDIINGCCKHKTFGDSEREEHNNWIDSKDVTLCYLAKDDERKDTRRNYTAFIDANGYWIVSYMQGADIPVDLYLKLRDTIDEYIEGLESEFENLKDGFEYESED